MNKQVWILMDSNEFSIIYKLSPDLKDFRSCWLKLKSYEHQIIFLLPSRPLFFLVRGGTCPHCPYRLIAYVYKNASFITHYAQDLTGRGFVGSPEHCHCHRQALPPKHQKLFRTMSTWAVVDDIWKSKHIFKHLYE